MAKMRSKIAKMRSKMVKMRSKMVKVGPRVTGPGAYFSRPFANPEGREKIGPFLGDPDGQDEVQHGQDEAKAFRIWSQMVKMRLKMLKLGFKIQRQDQRCRVPT